MIEKARTCAPFCSTIIGPFGLVEVRAYAEVSGDSNPIHLDPTVAARAGFGEPIVHGMLIVGHLVRLAEEWCADAVVSGVRSRFARPVGTSEVLHVEGRAIIPPDAKRGDPCILRVVAKNNSGMIAIITDVEFRDER